MTKWSKRSSVALDEETYAISRRVGNFSEFVRECLRRWNAYDTNTHIRVKSGIDARKCYPKDKKGCCILCWPNGPPLHEDWLYYMGQWKNHPTSATEFIERSAELNNITTAFPIPQDQNFRKSRKEPKMTRWKRLKRLLGLRG